MELVFLYGPPGVGKLTVARAVAARTGFRVFHNHLTVDLVGAVFPRGTPQFGRLISRFRRDMFAEAAGAGVDLIFTFVYAHPVDAPEVRAYLEPVQAAGGRVCFVQLTCTRDVLLARVADASRRAHGKIIDSSLLTELLGRYDLFSAVASGDNLRIDTTQVSAADAAAQIIAHYALPTVASPDEGDERHLPNDGPRRRT